MAESSGSLLCAFPKEQRQGVVEVFLNGVEVVVAAALLVEDVVVGGEGGPLEHLIGHVDGLAFDRVRGTHGVVDEISPLIEVLVLDELFDVIHVLFKLEVPVGAVIPAGAAHGEEPADIVIVIAKLEPGGDGAQGEAAEGPVVAGGGQVLRRGGGGVGMVLSLHGGHQVRLKVPVELTELLDATSEIPAAVIVVECSGDDDEGRGVAPLDEVVKEVLSVVEILPGPASPAVHQVEDVVPGLGVLRVVPVGRVDVGCLGDGRAVPDVVLGLVVQA